MGLGSEQIYFDSLREYVLTPIESAEKRVTQECEEIRNERQAYIQFKYKVQKIDTAIGPELQSPQASYAFLDSSAHPQLKEQLRQAFQRTVMSVDHYNDVYNESIEEHVALEFSPAIATVFRNDSDVLFTSQAKASLIWAVKSAIKERGSFLQVAEKEKASLENSRRRLDILITEREANRSPTEDQKGLEHILDEIATERQETLRNRQTPKLSDRHGLCSYLYQEKGWTYPVLTAVTRYRSSVQIN